MANKKVTDLPALSADVVATDELEISDTSAAAAAKSKRVTALELVNNTLVNAVADLPLNYLTGCILSNSSADSDTAHDVGISVGEARNNADDGNLKLTTAIYKNIEETRRRNREKMKAWRAKNPKRDRANAKVLYDKDPEAARAYQREWREKNPEKQAEYNKRHYNKNLEASRRYMREWSAHRRATDLAFKIKDCLRSRMRSIIHGGTKKGSAVDDLGLSVDEFIRFIAWKWLPDMTWENYGQWHLDHIRPLASFDLTDRTQYLEATHYSNYQPLWAEDNLRKSDKWEVSA